MLESHSIDEASECRTFANESGGDNLVRVGGLTNALLADRGSNSNRVIIVAFKTIATMADRYESRV
ncbi:unnamed protein product [Arabis nemorensis]|uniref:Uncharacterized protein n=1 Tax=Arabis nemorensis TaxID=586526 RepID=A0A565CHA0_9BRAS|nr:unnamed protein product [Arabis nemorensis]